jgi:hypothetical protein
MLPQPLFKLFELVIVVTPCESSVYTGQARVTGVIFRSPDSPRSLWAYQVTYEDSIEHSPWIEIPHSEIVAEDELRRIK